MTTGPDVRLRADARRNRERIIAAAARLFGAHGVTVPMEEIAKEASVGIGTLYRRFPDRDALLRGVAQDVFATVLTTMRRALDEEPTAWDAMVSILRHAVDMRLVTTLFEAPTIRVTIKGDPRVLEPMRQCLALFDDVVAAAHAEGSLRRDVSAGDIVALYTAVMSAHSHAGRDVDSDRNLGIVLDGLRVDAATPLPGRPREVP